MKQKAIILLVLIYLLVLPVQAVEQPRIVDDADLLTAEEERLLEESADEFREQYALDAVILTVDSLDGTPISVFADDYYDTMGYGVGNDYSGLILVVSMAERELYISTCGEAITRFSDAELDEIISGTASKLGTGEYAEAFQIFFGLAILNVDIDQRVPAAAEGHQINWFVSILIGLVAAAIAVLAMRSKMNTAKPQTYAVDYMKSDTFQFDVRRDMYLYRQMTKTPKPQNTGGSHSGTSVHRSSSGRSHGGRGGRF